ncbi:universal stress protein family protein [Kribbella amoyensis]|uniref:Universal stress protein family protein n=1 Tax=Kribbella amoyensis TaxID=996641 RepID=A0A561B6W3_9ACTN|nr:universal stress protein [Kribbella amoyensis]TWD74725.1 universal stress protein family protein [Kribbella amoyensis]
MTVVVGYLTQAEGRAALGHAILESTVRGDDLLVVAADPVASSPEFAADLALARASVGGRIVEVRTAASESEAGSELIDLSYDQHVALLVIGLRRRSPVGKLVLGSVPQQVLLDASCPVTAVKPPVTPA